jgi:ABC-type bacteriocin/lantibiotic exporter with double-glycine peptidase domain
LSGGQRQRIGIARALYHGRSVLILDEATSALDNQTEEMIMNKIRNLKKNITIIIIAHRLNTVKNCDVIFKLEKNGSIVKKNFNELTVDNKNFIQD